LSRREGGLESKAADARSLLVLRASDALKRRGS
jgi:hypothetical protein